MPYYDFICETCGARARAWRKDGKIPKYCSRKCKTIGARGKSINRNLWPITPQIHEKIKKVYKTSTGNGEVKKLCRELDYPRWKITRYAQLQGWADKLQSQPPWTDKEIDILERNGQYGPIYLQGKLELHGFKRTLSAIAIKSKRLKIKKSLDGFNAREVAECFGVEAKAVTRWIRDGKLKAQKRQTERTAAQGGDIFYIKPTHIRKFILENLEIIDIRKVDKFWFTDIVAGNWGRADDTDKWEDGEGYEL